MSCIGSRQHNQQPSAEPQVSGECSQYTACLGNFFLTQTHSNSASLVHVQTPSSTSKGVTFLRGHTTRLGFQCIPFSPEVPHNQHYAHTWCVSFRRLPKILVLRVVLGVALYKKTQQFLILMRRVSVSTGAVFVAALLLAAAWGTPASVWWAVKAGPIQGGAACDADSLVVGFSKGVQSINMTNHATKIWLTGNGTSYVPAVVNGRAFWVTQGFDMPTALVAANVSTGALQWSAVLPSYPCSSSAVVADSTRVYALTTNAVVAAWQNNGTLLWTYNLSDSSLVEQDPLLSNESVHFADDGGVLYALDQETGGLRWAVNVSNGEAQGSMCVENDVIAFVAGSGMSGVNATTGALLWYFGAEPGGSMLGSGTTCSGGFVYVALQMNNSAIKLNASTGALEWNANLNSACQTNPVVYEGVVYTSMLNGTLLALDDVTGSMLWLLNTGVMNTAQFMTLCSVGGRNVLVIAGEGDPSLAAVQL